MVWPTLLLTALAVMCLPISPVHFTTYLLGRSVSASLMGIDAGRPPRATPDAFVAAYLDPRTGTCEQAWCSRGFFQRLPGLAPPTEVASEPSSDHPAGIGTPVSVKTMSLFGTEYRVVATGFWDFDAAVRLVLPLTILAGLWGGLRLSRTGLSHRLTTLLHHSHDTPHPGPPMPRS